MSDLATALLAITGLFGLMLAVKQTIKARKLCAICLAVTLTWAGLLALYWLDLFDSQLLVGVLMGQSSLALYYLLEKRAPKDMLVFRLPVLLSLVLIVFSLLTRSLQPDALSLAAGIWLVSGILYAYRARPAFKNKVKALIECCSGW